MLGYKLRDWSHVTHDPGEVLGGFLGFPEAPSEIVCAPMICLGDKNYKELYILYYIMTFSIGKTSYFYL